MHRPYPNRDRALRQVDRHNNETPPLSAQPVRAVTPFTIQLTEATTAAVQALGASIVEAFSKMRVGAPARAEFPVGEYRLSTR